MLTGVAAHTILPQPSVAAAGAGLALTAYAHARGWPIPVGGSQAIVDAMAADLVAHGGTITTGVEVSDLAELPAARAVLLDIRDQEMVRYVLTDLQELWDVLPFLRASRHVPFDDIDDVHPAEQLLFEIVRDQAPLPPQQMPAAVRKKPARARCNRNEPLAALRSRGL